MALEDFEKKLEDTKIVEKKEEIELKPNEDVIKKVVKFSNEVRRQYGDLIKCVLIFGSAVRGTMKKTSDIDILVIIDDTATKGSESVDKIISQLYFLAAEMKDLHVQTQLLTEFWNWIKNGSPELVNYLRYGYPIYDTGFIKPIQRMLKMGLIPPSEETINLKAKASLLKLKKIDIDLRNMIFDLRYTAFDMIQAVIMYYYKYQPDYKDAKKYLEKLLEEKKITKEDIENFEKLDKLWKDIDHRVIQKVTIDHLKEAFELSSNLVNRFKELLPKEFSTESYE